MFVVSTSKAEIEHFEYWWFLADAVRAARARYKKDGEFRTVFQWPEWEEHWNTEKEPRFTVTPDLVAEVFGKVGQAWKAEAPTPEVVADAGQSSSSSSSGKSSKRSVTARRKTSRKEIVTDVVTQGSSMASEAAALSRTLGGEYRRAEEFRRGL